MREGLAKGGAAPQEQQLASSDYCPQLSRSSPSRLIPLSPSRLEQDQQQATPRRLILTAGSPAGSPFRSDAAERWHRGTPERSGRSSPSDDDVEDHARTGWNRARDERPRLPRQGHRPQGLEA